MPTITVLDAFDAVFTVAVYVAGELPDASCRVTVPVAAERVSVTALPLDNEVPEIMTPVPAVTIHVPEDTVIVVVGFAP